MVEKDPITGMDQLKIAFTPRGALVFSRVTRENVGKELAILVEGKILMTLRVTEETTKDALLIGGNFSSEEILEIKKRFSGAIWRE